MSPIDRRALFSSGAAAALLAATGVSLAEAPRTGGRLRLAVPREDDSLTSLVRGAGFETLTEIAPNGVLQGELATGWNGSANARTWQFELRRGVTFHDGRALRAQDVVSSLQMHDALGHIRIDAVRAMDPHRVRLDLAEGNPDLPILLADTRLIICADGQVDLPLAAAVGTGCYQTERFAPDRQYLGGKFREHHKTGRAGWIDSIEVAVIPDAAVRAEALRDGFVDIAVLPMAQALRGRDDLTFHPSADDMVLAASGKVGVPRVIGSRSPLDDGRLAQRWWKV